jgi:hypothetical protein
MAGLVCFTAASGKGAPGASDSRRPQAATLDETNIYMARNASYWSGVSDAASCGPLWLVNCLVG